MKIEITEEMISDWVETHKEDYKMLINKKIDTAVKSAINDAFSRNWNKEDGIAVSLVDNKVYAIISKVIESYEINTDDLTDKLMKQISKQVKNLSIKIV